MLPRPLLGPIRSYSSWCNRCPLAVCSWSTWGGFQGKYQRKQNASLAPTPVTGKRKLNKPCKSEIMHPAINGITVVVILLANDLSEQSRASLEMQSSQSLALAPLRRRRTVHVPVSSGSRCAMLPRAHVHLSEALAPGAGDNPRS